VKKDDKKRAKEKRRAKLGEKEREK